ncbi:MAG TPA: PASTA domain-containing protein [Longimicrobium sp.]
MPPKLLALAAFLACLAAPAPLRAQDDSVAVPDVTRRGMREVRRELRGARLELGRVDSADSRLPAGTVVAQDPPAGSRMRPGSRVDVTVSRPRRLTVRQLLFPALSSGADPCSCAPPAVPVRPGISVGPALVHHDFVRVPDLSGDTRREAERELTGVDLVRGAVDSAASTRPAGTVVGQHPAPGTLVRRGTPVRLTLARRPPVRAPGTAGDTLREAGPRRAGADSVYGGRTDPAGPARPPGTVPVPEPAAPVQVPPGTRPGVPPARRLPVPVPGFVGRPPSSGVPTAGSHPAAVPDVAGGAPPAGSRPATVPSVGGGVPPTGPRPVTVPDLAGGTPPTGPRPVTVPSVGGEAPAFPVIVLSPGAGEGGSAGTGSRPAVSPGSKPVAVPDLVKLTLAEAWARLEAAGFTVRTDPRQADGAWRVVSQHPAAGGDAPAGTPVLLTLEPPSPPPPSVGSLPWLVAAGVLAMGGVAALWRKRWERRGGVSAVLVVTGAAGRTPGSAKVPVGKLVSAPEATPRAHGGAAGVLGGAGVLWKRLRKRRGGASAAPVETGVAGRTPSSAKVPVGKLVAGPEATPRAHGVAAGVLGGMAALWKKLQKRRGGASTASVETGAAGRTPGPAKVLVAGPEVAPRAHAGAAGVLGGMAALWKRLRKRRGRVGTAPVVTATAEWDPGLARVVAAGALVSGPGVRLRAHADPGTQSVESGGPLVAAEVEG